MYSQGLLSFLEFHPQATFPSNFLQHPVMHVFLLSPSAFFFFLVKSLRIHVHMWFAIWYVWKKIKCNPVAFGNKHTFLYGKQVGRWIVWMERVLYVLQPFSVSLHSELSIHTEGDTAWRSWGGGNFITRAQNVVLFLLFNLPQILVLARKDGNVVSSWVPSLTEVQL